MNTTSAIYSVQVLAQAAEVAALPEVIAQYIRGNWAQRVFPYVVDSSEDLVAELTVLSVESGFMDRGASARVQLKLSDAAGSSITTLTADGSSAGGNTLLPKTWRVAFDAVKGALAELAVSVGSARLDVASLRRTPEEVARVDHLYSLVSPRIHHTVSLRDVGGDGTLNGGEKVGLVVHVSNGGEGQAKGVTVRLSGSSKALQYLGTSQTIGDIAPGQTGEAKFEAVLPNRIESDNGSIIIRVTEANGFDALEEKELIVAMQPAKVTRETKVVSTLVDVDAPLQPSSFEREDAYAVVVGISEYRPSSNLHKVTYARKDAEAVKDYLVGVCGFKEGNIKLLTDDGASLSDLTAYCEEWLTRNVRKGSFVFVYFAGHGTPSPDKGEAYLVPYDGEPGFVSKLYPLSRLYASLAALPTDQVVVALDACFSGAGGRSVMEQGKRPLVAVDLEKEAQKLGNVAVLTASAGNEISQDLDAKRHGLFTYYLLKGLRGEADSDKDGWITVKELYDYAKPKVLDESRRLGYDQTLQLLPEASGARASTRLARAK
ncbi:MAG: caspase family protein [candidate division WOR-3 bacterium]|nr:caspase family protein [candidate division WOR-3 bacterium]